MAVCFDCGVETDDFVMVSHYGNGAMTVGEAIPSRSFAPYTYRDEPVCNNRRDCLSRIAAAKARVRFNRRLEFLKTKVPQLRTELAGYEAELAAMEAEKEFYA